VNSHDFISTSAFKLPVADPEIRKRGRDNISGWNNLDNATRVKGVAENLLAVPPGPSLNPPLVPSFATFSFIRHLLRQRRQTSSIITLNYKKDKKHYKL